MDDSKVDWLKIKEEMAHAQWVPISSRLKEQRVYVGKFDWVTWARSRYNAKAERLFKRLLTDASNQGLYLEASQDNPHEVFVCNLRLIEHMLEAYEWDDDIPEVTDENREEIMAEEVTQ